MPYSRSPDKRYEGVDSLENFRGPRLEETLLSLKLKGTLPGRQDSSHPGQQLDKGSSRGRLSTNRMLQKHIHQHQLKTRTFCPREPCCSLIFPESKSPSIKGQQQACPDPSDEATTLESLLHHHPYNGCCSHSPAPPFSSFSLPTIAHSPLTTPHTFPHPECLPQPADTKR